MQTGEHWFIGECMIELRRAEAGLLRQSFAGDVYNTAVYFRRTAPERRTCFVSAVGADSMSAALLAHARKHGLQTDRVAAGAARPPGVYLIETTPDGERSFLYWRSDSAARSMLGPDHCTRLQQHLGGCRLLYFSGITLAILDEARRDRLLALAAAVKRNGGRVGFDSNYRPALWQDSTAARRWNTAAITACTHALLTFDDEAALHRDAAVGDTIARTLAGGAAEVVVKLGADGCVVQSGAAGAMQAVPAQRVTPVDTTAAGDSFNAAYLAARLAGATPVQAAEAGNRLAARVIQVPGAIIDDAA